MDTNSLEKITISVTVTTPLKKVWELWSSPEAIRQWCSASPDWHVPAATNDLREGGSFSTTMAAKDGSMQFDFGGMYDKVEPLKSISYTISDGRKVDITFEEIDGTTRIIETFDAETQNAVEMQRAGWQAILDNFKAYAERQ